MTSENASRGYETAPLPIEDAMFPTVDLGAFLARRKGILATGLVLGLALACLYFFLAPPVYSSSAQVLVMRKDDNIAGTTGQSRRDFQGRTAEDLLATHMELLLSPRVVQKAVANRDLKSLDSIKAVITRGDDPVQYIIENLSVDRGGEGEAKTAHVITVSFRHDAPQDCATVLDAVIESYQDFLGDTFQNVGAEAVALISQAKAELEKEIQDQEAAYLQFREQAPLLWQGDESFNVHQLRLVEIETALSKIRLRRTEIESRLAILEQAQQAGQVNSSSDLERLALIDAADMSRLSLIVTVDQGAPASEAFQASQPARIETASAEFDRLLALKLEEKSLLETFGEDHPKVREVRQNIQEVGRFLANNRERLGEVKDEPSLDARELVKAYSGLLQHDLKDLARRERDLVKTSEQERQAAKAMISFELKDANFRDEVARRQQLYNTVVDRLGEINLIKDYGGYVTEVISPVRFGEQVAPQLLLSLLLGGCLGLVFGAAVAAVAERADSSFRSPKQIRHDMNLPVLTHMGNLQVKKTGWDRFRKETVKPTIDPTILAYHRPKSREAEAIRGLRTAVYFSTRNQDRRVLQVTSPAAGDGKTTLISNLAVSLAQAGKRVLLVDCDLRRPRVHEVFSLDNSIGLADVLMSKAEVSEAWQTSEVTNLSILPSGPIPSNPAELLESPEFEQMLNRLRATYDFVLLDTPPVLAVSDPVSIAAHVDGVVLTIRLRKNSRAHAIRAKEVLNTSGVTILGTVVNGVGEPGGYYYRCGVDEFGGYAYGDGREMGQYYSDEPVTHAGA